MPILPLGFVGRIVCVALLTTSALAADASAQEIEIVPALKPGDQFRLDVTRVRENTSRPQQNSRSTTPVDVRVVSATAEGFVLEWVPGDSQVESPLAQDPLMLAAAGALEGLQLRLTLNAQGEVSGLANEDEVVPRVQGAVDVIVKGLLEQAPADQREGMQALFAQVLSPAALLGTLTRDAQMYFGLSGVSLAVGEAAEADLEQPNPLGGGVLPATYRVRLDAATGDSAMLTTSTTYDGAALLRSVRALVEQAGGKPVPDAEIASLPPFVMSDDGRYVMDRATGLMRELTVTRRVGLGQEQRIDRWEFRLSRPPQR